MTSSERSYIIGKSEVIIKFGDILDSTAYVYVSPDDHNLSSSGGVSLAIKEATGIQPNKELSGQVGQLKPGDITITSAGARPQSHIIHGITRWDGASDSTMNDQDVQSIVDNIVCKSLEVVEALGLNTIAFPAIGTGYASFGPKDAAVAMARAFQKKLLALPESITVELILCLDAFQDQLDFLAFFNEFEHAAEWEEQAVRENSLILVHGIRTEATWLQTTKRLFRSYDPTINPIDAGYGFFDVVRFLLPFKRTRAAALKTVEAKILRAHDHPNSKSCSIIAHSFGTYLVGCVLARNKQLKIKRLILCGCVMSTSYPWGDLTSRIPSIDPKQYPTQIVVNDCGWRDIWPVMAQTCTWGYGASGRFGFQAPEVIDRFFDKAHSDFFEVNFIEKYWCPFISAGQVVTSNKDSPTADWLLKALTVVKLPIVLLLVLIVLYGLVYL